MLGRVKQGEGGLAESKLTYRLPERTLHVLEQLYFKIHESW